MADGLSIVASVAGTATATLQSIRFLSKSITNIKDAPDTIRNIRNDLQAIEHVLCSLTVAPQSDISQLDSEEIRFAIQNCGRACKEFGTLLQRWVHSEDEKIFWQDRWRVGLFGLERIKALNGQLSNCKGTLTVALTTATAIKMARQEHVVEEMREVMLRQNEVIIAREIARADEQRTTIENGLRQISTVCDTEPDEESIKSSKDLRRELRHQQASNDAFRKACEEAHSKTVSEQKIRAVRVATSGVALVGFINTSAEGVGIRQDISDIIAESSGVAVVGVAKDVNFGPELTVAAFLTGLIDRKILRVVHGNLLGVELHSCLLELALVSQAVQDALGGSMFALSHEDLAPQNIIVDGENNIKGLIFYPAC
ncbi:hypothetical protein GQ53DRAFT_842471 [Thozetella sp. PMI_491]|nr:hypothetical protein GQ53DRAFT_842471 [Thozetella sp. PMI_491]